jgi:hypothetical protein
MISNIAGAALSPNSSYSIVSPFACTLLISSPSVSFRFDPRRPRHPQ